MSKRRSQRSSVQGWSAVIAGSALAASVAPAHAQWTKHFRVGMQLSLNIEAEFGLGGALGIPAQPGVYDDGYVLPDDSVNSMGLTTFWGYQNGSQVEGDSIAFSRTESVILPNSTFTEDDAPYLGLEAAYGGPITTLGRARLGWEVGYSFLPLEISDRRVLSGPASRITDFFDIRGIVVPEAPYNGSSSGREQPTLELDPFTSETTMGTATVSGPRTLDVSIHNLRVGPTLHWELARRWAVQASAGGAIGIATGDYIFNETITFQGGSSSRNSGEIGGTEFIYGAYVNGVVLFHVEEHGDIYAGMQFTTMSDSEWQGNGRSAKLNLGSAFSFLIGVNWPF